MPTLEPEGGVFRYDPERNDELDSKSLTIGLIVIFLGLAVLLILIIIYLRDNRDYVILFSMGLGIVILLLVLVSVIYGLSIAKRKKRYKIPHFDDSSLPRITEADRDRFIGDAKEPNLIRPKIAIANNEIVVGFSKATLTYTGSVENKSCVICKLAVRKDQEIWKCPYCIALFHREHLAEWLTKKAFCPVCQGKITIRN